MTYKISIILPVFNVENYIKEALDSITKQTIGFEDLEVIMVDDCSTDRCGLIMDEYVSKYDNFRAIHLPENSGPERPRNVGIEEATGEYLMFLDPDDFYVDDMCETLYEKIISEGVDVVFCNYNFYIDGVSRKNERLGDSFEIKLESIGEKPELLTTHPSIWTKIYKRDFILDNGIRFKEDVRAGDRVFVLETFLKARGIIYLQNYYGTNYRTTDPIERESFSNSTNKDVLLGRIMGYEKAYKLLKEYRMEKFLPQAFHNVREFWTERLIKSDTTPQEKKNLLEKISFLFKEFERYKTPVRPYKDYLIPLFNHILNEEYDDAVAVAERLSKTTIYSISMVKNEMDIIESFVRYNINILDGMIILDNGSTDETLKILKELKEEGLPLQVYEDEDWEFEKVAKIESLLKKAIEEFDVDIIVPLDADEFIASHHEGNPRRFLEEIEHGSYHFILWKTYIPSLDNNEDEKFIPARITYARDESMERQGKAHYKIVLHSDLVKAYGVKIARGSHDLLYNPQYEYKIRKRYNKDLRIAHFPIRSKEQTISKVSVGWINALSSVEREKNQSNHWQKIFNQLKANEEITMEDVVKFASEFNLKDFRGEVKITEDPLDLSFLKDIEIKYTDKKINPMANLLEACEKLSISYLNLKKDVKEGRISTAQESNGGLIKSSAKYKFPIIYILFSRKKMGLKNILINIKGYKSIKNNNLLDEDYYLKNSPDLKKAGVDPILHYIYHGFHEGRKPNPDFDGHLYLKSHPDVKRANINPLVHYSMYGIKEDRTIKKPQKSGAMKNNEAGTSKTSEIIKEKEKVYTDGEEIKYLFCESPGSNKLIISFPWFNNAGVFRYGYVKTIKDINSHKLFLLDDFGTRGCYLLGRDRDLSVEKTVISLIEYLLKKYNIKKENVILHGSSKGGWLALYYGIKYKFGYVIAGGPQTKLGDFLIRHDVKLRSNGEIPPNSKLRVADYISGGHGEEDAEYLDNLLYDLISSAEGEFPRIFIHVGNGDIHYTKHILPFINELDKNDIDYQLELKEYDNHDDIAKYYPSYLFQTLKNIFCEIRYKNNVGRSLKQRLISKLPYPYILFNRQNTSIKNAITTLKGYNSIKKNNLMDVGYYLKNNPDIRDSGVDPLLHYLYHGFKEGRKPISSFDSDYYLKTYPDVERANINPLVHYSLFGMKEGRMISSNRVYYDRNHQPLELLSHRVNVQNRKIVIKVPAPQWDALNWGDYHFALALKKEFRKNEYDAVINLLENWDEDKDADVVLVLRGLTRYDPDPNTLNIMWNISHPDLVSVEEYNQYNHVFIASNKWADELRGKVDVPVEPLLQCTDPKLFHPEKSPKYEHELLFVGNSRKEVPRKILMDMLPTDKDLAVYGNRWEGQIDDKYIYGKHIPNTNLHKAYSSCKILLNDHWDDMSEKGFLSNRLFDGFASGAFIISDEIEGANEIFGDSLITYTNSEELHKLIDHYLDHDEDREKLAEKGRKIVLNNHTFKKRVKRILEVINENSVGPDMVLCPICNFKAVEFSQFGNPPRNALCPRCGSVERHRAVHLFLKENDNLFEGEKKILHIAPEEIFAEFFSKQENIDYLPVDLDVGRPCVKEYMDIQDINYPDNTFDFILCSHVLEHVPDDEKAMKELYRVLKPGGSALILVPIKSTSKETLEDPSIDTPELRTKYYGQHDHLRFYGRDFHDKLKMAGFKKVQADYIRKIGRDTHKLYGLSDGDVLYFCVKE